MVSLEHFQPVDVHSIMVRQALLLVFCQFSGKLVSNFTARKLCHAGSGFLMLLLDPYEVESRYFVYSVVVLTLFMTWIEDFPAWRFATRKRDVGITIYVILVGLCFYFALNLEVVAPMFFADPAGAVFGKLLTRNFPKLNKRWSNSQKTIGGSLAVFITTYFTILFPCNFEKRLVLSSLATLAELIGGKYDNLCITLVIVFGYCIGV